MRNAFLSACVAAALVGCGGTSPESNEAAEQVSNEIATLKERIATLERENTELKQTPAALLANVTTEAHAKHLESATSALKLLERKFPTSNEAKEGKEIVETLSKLKEKQAADKARIAAIGFKGLKANSTFSNANTTIKFSSARVSSQWAFDAYGDEWHYVEAEKGERFVTAKVTVTSKDKDPDLMGIALYVLDSGKLRKTENFGYRLARWDDYSSYLGNEPDYRNDFSHSSSIPFSIGARIKTEDSRKPLYVIATKQACHSRSEDRFGNPPVSYDSSSCSKLLQEMILADFQDAQYAVLQRMN